METRMARAVAATSGTISGAKKTTMATSIARLPVS